MRRSSVRLNGVDRILQKPSCRAIVDGDDENVAKTLAGFLKAQATRESQLSLQNLLERTPAYLSPREGFEGGWSRKPARIPLPDAPF